MAKGKYGSILIVTGRKSYPEIMEIRNKFLRKSGNVKCDVVSVDSEISAFITRRQVEDVLKERGKNYDLVLLPGLIPWNCGELSGKYGPDVYKGTRFSGDLYDLLLSLDRVKLSCGGPADKFLERSGLIKITEHLENLKRKYYEKSTSFRPPYPIEYNGLIFGGEFPPLVFAEIVDAPRYEVKDIIRITRHFIESGADVIDIGTIINRDNEEFIRKVIGRLKKEFGCPISIDSTDIGEISAGAEAGADFILSIHAGNLYGFLDAMKGAAPGNRPVIIVIPLDGNGKEPDDIEEKLEIFRNCAEELDSAGFGKIMFDPLLKPPVFPGVTPSLKDYYTVYESVKNGKIPSKPLFMGFNNVTELMDADSPGINALLAAVAVELKCGGILISEHSPKCFGSVGEVRRGINLGYLASISGSPPLNLGYSAFTVKGKKKPYVLTEDKPETVISTEGKYCGPGSDKIKQICGKPFRFIHDPAGYFKIFIDRWEKRIMIIFYPSADIKKEFGIGDSVLIIGGTAEEIYKTIDKLGWVKLTSHAFYLGKELARAEYALKYNGAYFEDIDDYDPDGGLRV